MKHIFKINIGILSLTLVICQIATSQDSQFTSISLKDLQAFNDPGKNWLITSEFSSDYSKPWNLKKLASGTGMVINNLTDKNKSYLITKEEFRDIEVELDFMIEKGSNSGVYLQGRYEIQLLDSWLNPDPAFSDCGGIYQRWNNSRTVKGFEGMAPLANAARAPGLWQHLRIRFQAPRFGADGNKTANARFAEVYLNGVLVQQQVEVTGPTRDTLFDEEKPFGPLAFQGDHGRVAFRNIRYRPLVVETDSNDKRKVGPIIVNPDDKPYLLRSFMMFGDRKLEYAISMGSPEGLNYTYDLREGALLQIWRGGFLDATEMWHSRGEPQLAKPLGSVISIMDTPTVAKLPDSNMPWPDSLAFGRLQNNGYLLDKNGIPTFTYTIDGAKVSDNIYPAEDGTGFVRTLTTEEASGNLICRLVSAHKIESVDKGLYRVNGIYYVKFPKNVEPIVRTVGKDQDMLVRLDTSKTSLTYTIIW